MFEKVGDSEFITGEHQALKFWDEERIFDQLCEKNRGRKRWSFLDGPITANNPMGVHHAWGRTYKDAFQRYFAMTGHDQRYQNGFDCQGLWVEVEVEKELQLGTKTAINEYGIDRFVNECKKRVLRFAARQTEQSIRLGYWTDWDDPDTLRLLAEKIGTDEDVTITTPSGKTVTGRASELVAKLGCPEWGGSYFTFSTENNETIWTFLKKCFQRGKIYRGYDVMPWSGRAGSAYSQMEVADGRKLTVHRSCFVRFPILSKAESGKRKAEGSTQADDSSSPSEYLLVWTTTPWTLTSNVACAVNPDFEYVKLQTKRDNAIYYFAKDNLDCKRLDREFKEGFGGPDWKWPKDVPKLKSIAQIFKEQGGYEILGTVKGAEMVGWRYEGPFDELPAQHQPGGVPEDESLTDKTGVSCHRVIDGGRDNKGNANVVAGEGTGIVHIAPGCGDVDHKLGEELGLVGIAPLGEDGTFGEGFGPFTGKEAIDSDTAQLVFDTLKENHKLVYVEPYPHIYPHCWRTGDELVFRLVDEWFINMDWREEIKDVTRAINWLPASVDGQERELEWLTNMRDWMISKKRFWGLALPIWIVEDDPSKFQVFGSIAELKEWYDKYGGEGWEAFDGNTPHRPWIDNVRIRNKSENKDGSWMRRIVDVGNPWLDAGIVPFSTMPKESAIRNPQSAIQDPQPSTLNSQPSPWFPADFVTECFPGQFRNWFYSLLSLATMMGYDTSKPPDQQLPAEQKKPFKNLLGHRLVMNELGQQMHKTDGTAIWFEEAAEQLGVDTIRWLYLAQNPAQDLRFGTRHPDQPVSLQTPDGEITETKEGLPTCKVTSSPADEVRRQILIPLWNSYAFFVNYARLDDFDPNSESVTVAERPEIDRWILSNLQALIQKCRDAFEAYDTPTACAAAVEFIDDLSNWYIRRNRRRFWRSRKAESGKRKADDGTQADDVSSFDVWEPDKLAAYQTLYEVLLTLTKVLAPMIPFLSERMYRNLVSVGPESVHLCDYPEAEANPIGMAVETDNALPVTVGKSDPLLSQRMAVAQLVVKLGHKLREESNLRVRQPVGELRYACSSTEQTEAVESLNEVIREELNVKELKDTENLDDLVSYSFKPNLKTLGPKYGKLLGAIRKELPALNLETLAPLRNGQAVTVVIGGEEITLEPDDVLISTEQAADWVCADDRGIQIALSTNLTPELLAEGIRNDFVRHIQQARKDASLEIQDRICVFYQADDSTVKYAIEQASAYVEKETLADALTPSNEPPNGTKPVSVGEGKVTIWIEKVAVS